MSESLKRCTPDVMPGGEGQHRGRLQEDSDSNPRAQRCHLPSLIPRYPPVIKFHDSILGLLVLPPVSQHQDRAVHHLCLMRVVTRSGGSAGSCLYHPSLKPCHPSDLSFLVVRAGASARTGPWPAFQGAYGKEQGASQTQANGEVGGWQGSSDFKSVSDCLVCS